MAHASGGESPQHLAVPSEPGTGSERTPTSRWFESAGLRLHFADWGGVAGEPLLVFVHGGRDHCGAWREVIRRMPAGWRVLSPDLRGHGDSDWAPGSAYTPWDYAADLDALVRHAAAGERVVLVGHSLGGAVSLQYAAVRPECVAGVAVIEPFGAGRGLDTETALRGQVSQDVIKVSPTEAPIAAGDRLRNYLEAIAAIEARPMPAYDSVDEAVARMKEANPRVAPAIIEEVARAAVRPRPDGRYAWKFDNRVRLPSPYGFDLATAADLWRRIAAPVLILNGADSRPGRPPQSDGFEQFFADLQVVSVPGASHFIHVEQPQAVADLVTAFVRGRARVWQLVGPPLIGGSAAAISARVRCR